MATNANSMQENQVAEIDLLEIAHLLWQRIWLLIAGFVVGAVLAFTFTKFLVTPQYQAESIIYIFSKTTSITSLADLQMGSQLTEDFTIIATTRDVVESVIDELHLDTTYEALVKNISVKNPQSSHMLRINVKDPDPIVAANICNTLSERLREQIADIMNTDKPSVVQRAIPPKSQASPNVVRNTEIGALLGVVLVAAILIIQYMLDDTINTDEDVKKYLGVDVLAAFPYIRSIDAKKNAASSKGFLGIGKKSGSADKDSAKERQKQLTKERKDVTRSSARSSAQRKKTTAEPAVTGPKRTPGEATLNESEARRKFLNQVMADMKNVEQAEAEPKENNEE